MATLVPEQSLYLSWIQSDPEQKIGFRGGRFTRVNTFCSLLIGIVFTLLFYAVIFAASETLLARSFTQRGFVPYLIALFFFWSLSIVLLKLLKLRLQRRALEVRIVPDSAEFVLSPLTVEEVTDRIYSSSDDPSKFLLLNRVCIALSNLKNIGRVSDVDEILNSQADHDESTMETSYLLVGTFVWAIPVLGFIGTVLGLSSALGGFGSVLSKTDEMSQVKSALHDVTGGLSVAFETTLQGLVCALAVQLVVTFMKKNEEEFLDQCKEFCVKNIVGHLRVNPHEAGEV